MNITDCLVTLRVKGFVKAATLAEVTQESSEAAEAALQGLTNDGLAESTKMGVRLTPKGIAAANDQFAREHTGLDSAWIHALYERFCVENDAYKKLVTDWQMREVDGARVINDHRDADYDAGLLGDLAALHPRIVQIVQELAARLPRIAGYNSRFERALQRVQNGEIRYMTAPIIDSYHTVWFELHQELINLSGTTRAEEAAQGRAA
jgi:pyruvate, orthophosphate dikinase